MKIIEFNRLRLLLTPRYLVVALITLFSFNFHSSYADEPLVKIGVSGRPFFQYVNKQGQFTGLDIELSKLIFNHAEINVQYLSYPWPRIVHLVKSGKLDVALSAADSDERREYAYFSGQTFRLGHTKMYTLSSNASKFKDISSLSQLKGIQTRLAVLRGASYSTEYDKLLNEPWFARNLVILDSPSRTLESLIKGRVDAFIGSEYDIRVWASEMGVAKELSPVFFLMSDKEAETHIMYSKASVPKQWVEKVDKSIVELKRSGVYEKTIQEFVESY